MVLPLSSSMYDSEAVNNPVVVAVDDEYEDGVQWWRRGGHSMAAVGGY